MMTRIERIECSFFISDVFKIARIGSYVSKIRKFPVSGNPETGNFIIYGYVLLLENDLIKENELVARIVNIPVLRLSWTVALYVVNNVHELALECADEHTVT